MTKVDLRKLLQKVENARIGSPELDSEFISTVRSAPPNVTRSIDAAVLLIDAERPGWWWNCVCFELRNGASLYVRGSSRIRRNFSGASGPRPEDLRLLQDPKWGLLFDGGFHCDRGGTVPLAMLAVFLEAKIALMCVQRAQLTATTNNKVSRRTLVSIDYTITNTARPLLPRLQTPAIDAKHFTVTAARRIHPETPNSFSAIPASFIACHLVNVSGLKRIPSSVVVPAS